MIRFAQPLPFIPRTASSVIYDRFGDPLAVRTNEFGELTVAQRETIFDSKQIAFESSGAIFDVLTTGDGDATYSAQRSSTLMTVTSAGRVVRQTRRSFNYQPSKRTELEITAIVQSLTGDAIARYGLFDDNNGMFIEFDSSGVSAFVIRSDVSGVVVDTRVERADWDDRLDSTGPSGYTIDSWKAQLAWFSFAWLGVGSTSQGFRWGDAFVRTARVTHAQAVDSVYMRTPNLPVRWEIVATNGGGVLEAICCAVSSEGGHNPLGFPHGDFANGLVCPSGAITEIMTGRLAAGSSATVYPTGFEVEHSTQASGVLLLVHNPTYAASPVASWRSPQGANGSHVKINHTARVITSMANVGHILATKRLATRTDASVDIGKLIAMGRAIDGTPDEISIVLNNTSLSAATVNCCCNWTEVV